MAILRKKKAAIYSEYKSILVCCVPAFLRILILKVHNVKMSTSVACKKKPTKTYDICTSLGEKKPVREDNKAV